MFGAEVAGMPLSFMNILLMLAQTLSRNKIFATNIARIFVCHDKTQFLELRPKLYKNKFKTI